MDMGGTLELFPCSRVSPRVDFVQTLYVVPGAADPWSGHCCEPQAVLAFPGKIADTFQFSVGVDYKLGTKRRGLPEDTTPGRWTIGAQFVHAVATSFGELSPFQNPGAGAFVSYRAFGPVYADAAVAWYAHEQEVRTPWDGGRVVQALAGVAVGPRRAGVGLFFQARAGIASHAEAYAGRESSSRTLSTTRSNNAALDFGGIIELDMGRRTVVRIEMSDLIVFYGTRAITIDGVVVPQPSLESKQNMQMSIGMGLRF
jgi:hypothetical protein